MHAGYDRTMTSERMTVTALRRVRFAAWFVLALTVVVVMSGDVVQATDSGAGCGESWPRCDGALIPGIEDAATAIEFSHRLLTTLLGVAFVALVIAARLAVSASDDGPDPRIWRLTLWSSVFFLFEVAIGALLVRFGWVGDDSSVARVVADGLHVVNTFFLVGALTLTAITASGPRFSDGSLSTEHWRVLITGAGALLLVAVTGAVNSLADVLYPAGSLAEGVRADLGPVAPLLVRMRAAHPFLAVVGGGAVWAIVRYLSSGTSATVARWSRTVQAIVIAQFALGLANLILLTPLETQILHLLAAHAIWVGYIMFAVTLRADRAVMSSEALPA